MKVLITGVTGFVGSHLAEFCQNLGNVEVVGAYRWRSPKHNIAHIKDLELVEMDILDATSCRQTLAALQASGIYDLLPPSAQQALGVFSSNIVFPNAVGQ